MNTGLIFVVVLSTVRGCSSASACTTSQTPAVGACTATQSGQVTSTLYLDTGTGPNYQENRCQCKLSLSHTSTELEFKSLHSAESFDHTIEVAGYVLNRTTTRLEVVLESDADISIKTDGTGGVCVSVTIKSTDIEKRFGITCYQQSPNLTTTTSSSSVTSAALQKTTTETTGTNPTSSFKSLQTTTTETTGTNPASSSKSQTNEPDENNENLIGPVVGGLSGFVVLVSITAAAICCIRRKHSKLKENSNHSDKTSNAQTNSKYTDMTENSVSDKAVAENRSISIIDCSYDDVNLDRGSGCHKDKRKQTENDCHVSVYYTNEKPVQTNQNNGKLAVYSVVNKHSKQLTNTVQDTNESFYDRTDNSGDKVKGMEEYNRLGDNVYDRTDNSVEKEKGMEEYNRLGDNVYDRTDISVEKVKGMEEYNR